ncbi:MAG TPA: spore germination protein [Clostridiales bacterium]|nr:spore germination protein [Clostridiales bacterium]
MSRFFKRKQDEAKEKKEANKENQSTAGSTQEDSGAAGNRGLFDSLDSNIETVRSLFRDVDILRIKYISSENDKTLVYGIVYLDGMVDPMIMNESLIRALIKSPISLNDEDPIYTLMTQVLQINEMKDTGDIDEITEAIAYGDTVLFINGINRAVILNTRGFQARSISEPENEKNITGPREGFTESLTINLTMVRRKVLSPDLKMKTYTLGKRTKTKACICYMESLIDKQILAELYRRLSMIDIDAVLDTNYITELIGDAPWSPFRAIGYTERPDVVVGKLMEGRIAVFLDGTPEVLTLPYLFIENFQSSEDYYLSFFYTSFSRMLRVIGFFLTVTVPGVYIAIIAYHPEMMPLQLFISIAAERQSVPLPAALEAFVMVFVFDILRETGVRMPSNIGQTLSIVGALVIGQASVEAKLIAAPMIIIVGLTGITSLLVPKLNAPVIYIRFVLLVMATFFGFFGIIIGISCVLIHTINLSSFGVSQLGFSGKFKFQSAKDTVIRAPWWEMILRPIFAKDKVREEKGGPRK